MKHMEIISENTSTPKRIKYHGKGIEFALIYFKNIILTFITLGLYYPWAKVEMLNYHYQTSELDDARFQFHGTGTEVFKGFVKVYILFIVLYSFFLYSAQTEIGWLQITGALLFYAFMLLLLPLALHGMMRYRSSRSSWKGIHFKYLGNRGELFWICLRGFLLTIFTLGIYGAWFQVDLRKYILSHLRFGNLSFNFKGQGKTLLWIHIKFFLLIYITLGIYSFWYYKNLWKFYSENTTVTQDEKEVPLKFNMGAGDVFELVVVNFFIILFTLGLGTPWVIVRTFTFFFKFIELDGAINTNAIQQANYDDYDDAAGDDFLDFLDVDLL